MGDTDSGGFREHDPADGGASQPAGDDLTDWDEVRVQRTEDERVVVKDVRREEVDDETTRRGGWTS